MDGNKPESSKKLQHSIPTDILDDLSSRFIINMPEEERSNLVRCCFQVEMAHWFYLDFYCTDDSHGVHPCGIREFAAHIFQHIPFLQKHRGNLDSVLDSWREYKLSVPTYGAILLDTELTHVLLVQSYWAKASWGFPKGKVSHREEPWHCAAREVLEETGFDISKLINKNDFIESTIHDQLVRLYIIGHIPRDTRFVPRTRNEIKACEWFPLCDLPANKKDVTPKLKMGVSANAFFMILPFVKRIRRWVSERNPKALQARRTRHKSMGELEASTGKPKVKNISQGLKNEIQEFQQSSNGKAKGNGCAKNTPNAKKEKKHSKRQLFTPQNVRLNEMSAESRDPGDLEPAEFSAFLNFVAPSWANFKLDRRAILECFT